MNHSTDHGSYADDDGRLILMIPVANRPGRFAKIEAADYARLCAGRRSLSFYVNDDGRGNHVKLRAAFMNAKGTRQNNAMVSRLILQPKPGFRVYCRNGDKLDMRRANLELRPWGKQGTLAVLAKAGLLREAPADLSHANTR